MNKAADRSGRGCLSSGPMWDWVGGKAEGVGGTRRTSTCKSLYGLKEYISSPCEASAPVGRTRASQEEGWRGDLPPSEMTISRFTRC